MAAWKKRWPLGRGFERFYGFLGGESSCWYPDLIHDNHPTEPPATPDEGYHIAEDLSDKAIEFIRDAKVVEPEKPFFLYFSLDAAHAPHHVFQEWADKYKGVFDEGYEAIRDRILARQKELGLLPDGHGALGHQPPRRAGRHRARRPALADARHRPSLGVAQRRREAAVRPDGGGVRRLRGVHRRPGGSRHRLPGVLRRARQHDRRRRLRQRSERRGRPQRDLQRVALLQRRAHADRADPGAHRRARRAEVLQPLQHRLGLGLRHPLPLLEALGGLRGRHRGHVPRVLAGQGPGGHHAAVAVRARRRRRARRSTT